MKKYIIVLFTSISLVTYSQIYINGSGVTDIEGNNYKTIIINGQEWTAEDLRTSKYSNGEIIPNVTNYITWSNLPSDAWVFYENNSVYNNPFGKLYNWYAASDNRNICPSGWHVPKNTDWNQLIKFIDVMADTVCFKENCTYSNSGGGKLKSTGTLHWLSPNLGATNESGFSSLPSGYRSIGDFSGIGQYNIWWSSEIEVNKKYAYSVNVYGNEIEFGSDEGINEGYSIRCIKNKISGIDEVKINPKRLIRIFNILGQVCIEKPNEVLFYEYSDGSIEKKINIE